MVIWCFDPCWVCSGSCATDLASGAQGDRLFSGHVIWGPAGGMRIWLPAAAASIIRWGFLTLQLAPLMVPLPAVVL